MKSGFFLYVVGLIMTMGGVGGVEQSLDNLSLVGAGLIALLGLAVMYCGVMMIKINERPVDNPTLW
jgi:hypothetical protein